MEASRVAYSSSKSQYAWTVTKDERRGAAVSLQLEKEGRHGSLQHGLEARRACRSLRESFSKLLFFLTLINVKAVHARP